MSRPVLRFAPSPNGELHLGHAFSALLAHDLARATGGRFLLRIEDIDGARCRPEYEAAIFEDLTWLGVAWEEPVRRQSRHMDDYADALVRLEAGGLLYPCYATRGEIAAAAGNGPRDPDGAPVYPGLHRGLDAAERARLAAEGRTPVLRLDMAAAIARLGGAPGWREDDGFGRGHEVTLDPMLWGDAVLKRRDTPTSYHLAVVVDDAAQGMTLVPRGRDLHPATAVHRVLQDLLGLPRPAYLHHRLIPGSDGLKLSKSRRDTGLASLRRAGARPADIRRMVGL